MEYNSSFPLRAENKKGEGISLARPRVPVSTLQQSKGAGQQPGHTEASLEPGYWYINLELVLPAPSLRRPDQLPSGIYSRKTG